MKTLILAIESSCDDSSIALIDKDTLECHFHQKISQENAHSNYGGVVPELAARLHSEALPRILERCGDYFERLCAVAVTNGPGLSVSLVGGIAMAKILALSLKIPLIAVNHLVGHIHSLFLQSEAKKNMGILLVSGGHTMVLFVDEVGGVQILAQSTDDSFGESFDKVAKMLGLGYPGGEAVQKLALKAQQKSLKFSIPLLRSKELAFSFSGLKNQVRLELLKHENLDDETKSEVAYAFEEAACGHILRQCERLFKIHAFKHFGVVGGASANLKLRAHLRTLCEKYSATLHLAPLEFCADNALMIARAAVESFKRGEFAGLNADILSPKNQNLSRI